MTSKGVIGYSFDMLAIYFLVAVVLHIIAKGRLGTYVSMLFYAAPSGGASSSSTSTAPSDSDPGAAIGRLLAPGVPSVAGGATAGGIAGLFTGLGIVPGAMVGVAAATGAQAAVGAQTGAAVGGAAFGPGSPGQVIGGLFGLGWPLFGGFSRFFTGQGGAPK